MIVSLPTGQWGKVRAHTRKVAPRIGDPVPPSGGFAFSSPSSSDLAVGQTFLLGLFQCLRLDEQALTFISLAGAAPLEHDGRQRRVLTRAPGECRIAGGDKGEVIQVGAGQAKCALAFDQCDPRSAPQLLATLIAGGIGRRNEYLRLPVCSIGSTPHPKWQSAAVVAPLEFSSHPRHVQP